MRRAGQTRFFFALAALLLWLAPASAQSPAPQNSPAGTSKTRADPRRAKKAFQKGLRAEQAEDWRAAFDAHAEAAAYSPGDTDLILRREAARFRIVQQHTDRAEREALAGRMEHAREELRAALQLDPGFSVARERLAQFSPPKPPQTKLDRKSTRLNSSHGYISYAVFCLKKKKNTNQITLAQTVHHGET